jgi:hypothetical protein
LKNGRKVINQSRLSNVIFDKGVRLSESQVNEIIEVIESDKFTLNEHVIGYKKSDLVLGKLAFRLNDDTTILVSEDTLSKINSLDMDKTAIEQYMSESNLNFAKVVAMVLLK